MGWMNYRLDHWAIQFVTCYWPMSVWNTMNIAVHVAQDLEEKENIAYSRIHWLNTCTYLEVGTTKANYNSCQVGSRREEAGMWYCYHQPLDIQWEGAGMREWVQLPLSTWRWKPALCSHTSVYILYWSFPWALFTYLCECSVAHTSSKHFTHKCPISIITELHIRKEKTESLQQIAVVFHESYILIKTKCSYGILHDPGHVVWYWALLHWT